MRRHPRLGHGAPEPSAVGRGHPARPRRPWRPSAAGASQADILSGFIDAGSDSRDNYGIAREYLTAGFADEWQAEESATIDVFTQREFEVVDDVTRRVDVVPAASLGANGEYEISASDAPIALTYSFEQVDGEWRISNAPQGILIDTSNFGRAFREHALTFLSPDGRYAVPDVRWFAGSEAVQTKIVRALLGGPAEWLDPGAAVVSAFPEGARLEADVVPIVNGVATVDIAGVDAVDRRTAQLMRFQLTESLEGVRGVGSVRLALEGAEQNQSDAQNEPVVDPAVRTRPVVFDGETFGHLQASGDVDPLPILGGDVAAAAPTAAAVGPGGTSVAAVTADGLVLFQIGEEPLLLDPREGLIAPALDARGITWSVPRNAPDQLVVYTPTAADTPIDVPWSGSSIRSLEVSRDGTRVLALLDDGASARLVAASVVRDEDGVPTSLGPVTLPLAVSDGEPLDVAWIDDRTVAVLTSGVQGQPRILVQTVGGEVLQQRAAPADAVELDGGNTVRELRVRTSAGDLFTLSGVGWQPRASGIRLVAVQQPD
ncbi:hypothetical protein ET445_15610 [Agromyces protaetiae]|uniref:GerMN domain-containing protein n=1 Tax=Agromyces protaetiae TaxID=2509455 RepID=A0A4P6FF19_9MICO|nr:GerMN domain-containing protein [Agromyces protaetiae]QAY74544.1 hypothetical protein ET445_15610 [Agromyces protaetiae]